MDSLINLTYLTASVLFILGLKDLSHPRTAVRGNLIGAVGMLLAIVATLFDRHIIASGLEGLAVIGAGVYPQGVARLGELAFLTG